MKKFYFTVILAAVLLFSVMGYSHENHNKTPRKVTNSSIISTRSDTININQKTSEQIKTEQDFETIRQEVKSSSVFIVFKAIGLALAIGGLAFVYLRRRNKGDE
ncbi:hypothetical protein BMS3Abin05_00985 [bacterium BMS3Abin05]|nr:hypothetical protein BMS3Abin05_00985 [bacterium BMS3Abin05]GBE27711.1 hypothetical protein BMS3Bbin03_01640 [bacterium BMS3Bbin03]HDK36248.1 hypothetical protein [Bacteroidota bacterium]HDZ11329.1 hypothetical protein [Bacteroidota bacterium]